MPESVLSLFSPQPGQIICDCTLGGGGHTKRLLEATPNLQIIGIDRDPHALAASKQHLAEWKDNVTFVHGKFGDIANILDELSIPNVDGFLLDIGVSSAQLDNTDRGFSFARSGPLDMRMDPTQGETALELLHRTSEPDLSRIIRDYGEERYHKRVAGFIHEAMRNQKLKTTGDLEETISRAIPVGARHRLRVHPATKTFQALRIVVNNELGQLEDFLRDFVQVLRPGGKCAVISFHSLEDRLVKRRFRSLTKSSSLPPNLAKAAGERIHPVVRLLTKKPITASDDEVDSNPRSRSAKLRACEKLTSAPSESTMP